MLKTIRKHIKDKSIKPIYLFTGQEGFLIERGIKNLVAAILTEEEQKMNYDIVDSLPKDPVDLVNRFDTLPFFASHRVVHCRQLGLLKIKSKEKRQVILEGIKSLSPMTYLIIEEDSLDKRSGIYKAVQKKGMAFDVGYLSERDLVRTIQGKFKKEEKDLPIPVAKHLIHVAGYQLQTLEKECEKLLLYAQDRQVITRSMIDDIVTVHIESKVFQLVDALVMKKRERAFKLYQDLVALKEPLGRILYLITRQFKLLYQAKIMGGKTSDHHLAKQFSVPPFVVAKLKRQGRQLNKEDLKEILQMCLQLDYDVKKGTREIKTGMEVMMFHITQGKRA